MDNINKAIKENYLIITTLPLLLASGWQVFSLGLIGVPYIRFFSTTQLIADAAIIVFLLFSLMLMYLSIKVSFEYEKNRRAGKGKSKENNKKHGIVFNMFSGVLLMLMFGLGIYFIILPGFKSGDATTSFFGYMMVVYIASYMVMYALEIFTYKNIFIRVLVNVYVFGLIVFTSIYFNSIFANYSNFENIKKICKTETCKVKYFNDKHVFIIKDSKSVQVVKFEELFK